jgi:biopolymer transport protein ExbD
MAHRRPKTTLSYISGIQLTSMMDLSFLLLITFIISFPLIEQGIAVNLPRGPASELRPDQTHSITVDERNRIHLDDAPVSLDQLTAAMNRLGRTNPSAVVRIRADERLNYGSLVKVLRILHDAKIARMALVTQAAEKGTP